MRVLLPPLERAQYSLPDAGLLAQFYLGLCEEMAREPEEELGQRIHAVLVSAGVPTPDGAQ